MVICLTASISFAIDPVVSTMKHRVVLPPSARPRNSENARSRNELCGSTTASRILSRKFTVAWNASFPACHTHTHTLQLDVCDHNQWWRHLVNAYEVETGMVLFAGKTVTWSMPERLWCQSRLDAIKSTLLIRLLLLLLAKYVRLFDETFKDMFQLLLQRLSACLSLANYKQTIKKLKKQGNFGVEYAL